MEKSVSRKLKVPSILDNRSHTVHLYVIRLWLVATGHQVGRQIQVLKEVRLLSLGITDKTGGGITVPTIVYEQLRSQMMKKMQLLFLVRIGFIHCSPCLICLSVMLFFSVYNIQYMVQANKVFPT
jgi:hypothetical protein